MARPRREVAVVLVVLLVCRYCSAQGGCSPSPPSSLTVPPVRSENSFLWVPSNSKQRSHSIYSCCYVLYFGCLYGLLLSDLLCFFQICDHRLVSTVPTHGLCSVQPKYECTACGVKSDSNTQLVWAVTLETGTIPLLETRLMASLYCPTQLMIILPISH